MIESYKIVYEGGSSELVEKKSRFIAVVLPIHTEEEATLFLEQQRKKYWDARHHCFAYVLGERNEIQRCSDDGEPSGTAGRPMLDVLLGEQVHNVMVIVIRYFGGTLLGTGGLVRAYSQATKLGLQDSLVVDKCFGKKLFIETDYNGIGKLQYIIGQLELTLFETIYTEIVKAYVLIPVSMVEAFEKKVIEATAGKARLESLEEVYYANVRGEIIQLE